MKRHVLLVASLFIASFYVSSLNHITGGYFPFFGGLVNFVTQRTINKSSAASDVNGLVTAQWALKDDTDRLTAKIADKDGQMISEATFIPQYEEDGGWVLINGVKWATRNVGTPGTFVQGLEDYGSYYQWNKGTTNFLLWEDYYNSSYWNSTSWLKANDPSPAGYRVPTSAEIQSLVNTAYVSNEWTSRNGIYGRKFTDKATGKSLFLPAAGCRGDGDGILGGIGSYGEYWSSTQFEDFIDSAYELSFYSGNTLWSDWNVKSNGYSVRPVAE